VSSHIHLGVLHFAGLGTTDPGQGSRELGCGEVARFSLVRLLLRWQDGQMEILSEAMTTAA